MLCPHRAWLERNYERARATLDVVREQLRARIDICPIAEFLALSDELYRTWEAVDIAHTCLDDHVREHCCLAQHNTVAPG